MLYYNDYVEIKDKRFVHLTKEIWSFFGKCIRYIFEVRDSIPRDLMLGLEIDSTCVFSMDESKVPIVTKQSILLQGRAMLY